MGAHDPKNSCKQTQILQQSLVVHIKIDIGENISSQLCYHKLTCAFCCGTSTKLENKFGFFFLNSMLLLYIE